MKKNIVRIFAFALVLTLALATLAACATKLSGSYKCDDTKVLDVTLTFDGDKVTAKGKIAVVSAEVSGTYSIDGDKITLNFGDDKFDIGGTHSFEKDGDTIKINNVSYTKQK